jgi:hypothetical protein
MEYEIVKVLLKRKSEPKVSLFSILGKIKKLPISWKPYVC